MELIQRFLTKNPCYQANLSRADSRYVDFQKNGPRGLMLHSVGCAQPDAAVFLNRWDSPGYTNACVHGFIDGNTGVIYQTLPWNYRGWHAGGAANNTHVGVEMCESKHIRYRTDKPWLFEVLDLEKARADARRTYNAAVELFARLCLEWDLDPVRDVCSHREGGRQGIASGHVDPEHYWEGLGLGYTMDDFRAAVKAETERLSQAAAPAENPFCDVEPGTFCYDAVLWAAASGITRGTDETHFSPDQPCTRAETVAMLHRMAQWLGKTP